MFFSTTWRDRFHLLIVAPDFKYTFNGGSATVELVFTMQKKDGGFDTNSTSMQVRASTPDGSPACNLSSKAPPHLYCLQQSGKLSERSNEHDIF
jgi:hypothetical protein